MKPPSSPEAASPPSWIPRTPIAPPSVAATEVDSQSSAEPGGGASTEVDVSRVPPVPASWRQVAEESGAEGGDGGEGSEVDLEADTIPR